MRVISISLVCVISILMAGCYPMMLVRELFKEQEWSDNYARYPGVECTVPELIDGDTLTSVKVPRQIVISFPKRFTIRRIILKNTNVEDLIIYSSLGENEWKEIVKIKGNSEDTLDLRVFAYTDKLMFRLGETREDTIIPGRISKGTGLVYPHLKLGIPKLAEVEIYGFKEKKPKEEELIF